MKIFLKIALTFIFTLFVLTSCDDMFDVNSDRLVKTDDFIFSSANDSVRTLMGVFAQTQKLAERFVLLGELRGDLMDVNAQASADLKQINNFNISPGNKYNNIKDYYAVINNCNFLSQKIDTNIITGGFKMMSREYAAVRVIRAWTYLQIALNYDSVTYYEQPILTVSDTKKEYPKYSLTELAPILIQDLLPLVNIEKPGYGVVGYFNASYFFIPTRFLLGELYLWSQQYEQAALQYRELLFLNKAVTAGAPFDRLGSAVKTRSNWEVVNGVFKSIDNKIYRNRLFVEIFSLFGTSWEYGDGSHLMTMSYPQSSNTDFSKVMIKPSDVAIANWDNQNYFDSNPSNYTKGDLRGYYVSYKNANSFNNVDVDDKQNVLISTSTSGLNNYIYKYFYWGSFTEKYEILTSSSTSLVYLRYAEAVNRLGKPNLAFAVLKYGLNNLTLGNSAIIPRSELTDPLQPYLNFKDTRFEYNIGMHARGCGYVEKAASYAIPAGLTQDSINFVEDQILLELALENAFEGNRFYDLMRVAIRRNDNTYLAAKVAAKHTDNKDAIYQLLSSDRKNWYLPIK